MKKLLYMVGIYKITNQKGEIYIGQSWDLEKRQAIYKYKKCSDQPLIYNSLCKYGWESHKFEVVYELPNNISQRTLDIYEKSYILHLGCNRSKNRNGSGLNLTDGGSGRRGNIISEETRRKISENTKKAMTPEICARIKEKRKLQVFSNETRELWSKQRKGKGQNRPCFTKYIVETPTGEILEILGQKNLMKTCQVSYGIFRDYNNYTSKGYRIVGREWVNNNARINDKGGKK